MLIPENLDNESFSDIVKKAVGKIPKIYPAWSNYNSSDSGITILELLSWYKEIQQYHLNVIGRQQYLRYLKLLGKYPENIRPAQTVLKIAYSGYLPAGTVFCADDIPFETEEGFDCLDNDVLTLHSEGQTVKDYRTTSDNSAENTVFYPFGTAEEPQDSFVVCFKNEIPADVKINLFFDIKPEKNYDKKHYEDFNGFIEFHAEVYDGSSWNMAGIINDETCGFFKSGIISIRTLTKCSCSEKEFTVRFVRDSGEFVVPPVITSVFLNAVKACQKFTYSRIVRIKADEDFDKDRLYRYGVTEFYGVDGEKRIPLEAPPEKSGFTEIEIVEYDNDFAEKRIAGTAHGFCEFVLKYELTDPVSDGMEIYIKESDGCFYRWQRVRDFDKSDKYSRHFVFDESESEFIFGDGEKGMPPEGEIYVMSCVSCRGAMGNVKAGTINSFSERENAISNNISAASGGSDPETIDECFRRTIKELETPDRCITFSDYENAVRSVPGVSAGRIRAFANEQAGTNEIIVAIETQNKKQYINPSVSEALKRKIIPRSVIGTKVSFIPAGYAGLELYIEIVIRPNFVNVRSLTENALYDYFRSENMGFGCTINRNSIIDYIYSLAWVSKVKALDISVRGNNAQTASSGDITLKKHCLPEIESITIMTDSE